MSARAASGSLSGNGAQAWLARRTSQAPYEGRGPAHPERRPHEADGGDEERDPAPLVVRLPRAALQGADATGVERAHRARRHGRYTGTTALRFQGRWTTLPSAISSARQIVGRVSRGSMTSSTMPFLAAT